MAFLPREALEAMGFAALGENVLISDKASIYGAHRIRIGSHVRIDDFAVLSAGEGGIEIGNYVHIAVFCSLIGAAKITISDFCGLSGRVSIYSSTDDYSGEFMTNPMVPKELTNVKSAEVVLEKYVNVGCGTVILPGARIKEGAAIGALCLVGSDCEAFTIYATRPARPVMPRKKNILDLVKILLNNKS